MSLEEIRESYYRLEQDYMKQKELLTKAESRVRELEEERRWRKWPEEKPEDYKEYWVLKTDPLNDNGRLYPTVMEGWEIAEHSDRSWKTGLVLYFRPIGELPKRENRSGRGGMRQFYADECTANPLWLFQVKGRFGTWETISVFGSRGRAEQYGQANSHTYGERNKGWQVWSVPCFDEGLAEAVGKWKNSDEAGGAGDGR